MARYTIAGLAFLLLLPEIALLCLGQKCLESEKQALLKFKASIIHDPSNSLSSWNLKTNCCHWHGITCHSVTGHVLKLDLPAYGQISDNSYQQYFYPLESTRVDPSLLELQHLVYLDLAGNNFNAIPIPVFFGSMEQLRYLSIFDANFTGKIPPSYGNLTNLRLLDLSWNYLHINDMNWVSNLQSLRHLNLSGVYLGEAHNLLQVLHMLPSLLQLKLVDCGLYNLLPLPPNNFTNNVGVQVLHLGDNQIDSGFLDAFQNWTSIKFLYLYSNNLSSVPLWLGKSNSLLELDISDNLLYGSLPFALQNLTSISVLLLSGNYLSLVPSWFGEFKNLVSLDLSSNRLHGPIPHALQNTTSLVELYLPGNNLSSVPSWLGEFKNLVTLNLSSNTFGGPIPIVFRNLTSLEFLSLSRNNFSSIPSWLGELKSLLYLFISSNHLTTTMEDSVSSILRNICHLKVLHFRNSNLQGQAFGNSNFYGCVRYDIEELDLGQNKLNGNLPTWLGHLEKLIYLDLSNNSFSGNIPQSLGYQLVNLRMLYLYSNSFNGNIPQSLGQLVNLEYLDLASNFFSGNIPQSLGQLVNLTYLNLSNNSLSGNIPKSLGQLVNLHWLVLSRNYLHGLIPNSFSLENSLINGSIPRFLCQIETLEHLDLSYNNFSGKIPNCWRDSRPGLLEINFSFNNLSGVFPISFGKLSTLLWLHLNNNGLEGQLPLTLRKLKQLRLLDLGENKFSGSIPSWTSKTFPTLQILRLRNNMLDGNIPSHVCQLTSLHILDLANNNLNGSIPSCIGNLTGMTKDNTNVWGSGDPTFLVYVKAGWFDQDIRQVMKGREYDFSSRILQLVVNMDLSNNNLIGLIPIGVYSLTGLIGLNLSHNHLKGEIPGIIGDMKSLESFDISCNQISDTIPKSMSTLTSLSHLNMSYNNFSGPIPTENQFLTFNDPSIYVGNRYLCGIPLPNKCVGNEAHQFPEAKELEDENDSEKVWFFFVIAVGFIVGFWGAIGTLVLKKSWRYACFRRVEDVADEIYVYTVIKVTKLKRMLRNHVHG